jgi:hypothetical protein
VAKLHRWLLPLAVALPVAAFVYVPQRGNILKAAVAAPANQDYRVQSDLDGRVLLSTATGITVLHDGQVLWGWRVGPDETLLDAPQPGDEAVVVTVRSTKDASAARVIAFANRGFTPHEATRLWSAEFRDVPADGVRVPMQRDRQEGDHGVVGVLTGVSLATLDLATGQTKGRRVIGHVLGSPVWVEDTGFALTTDGYRAGGATAGAPSVTGFDIPAAGQANDRSTYFVWPVPQGETIDRLEWLPDSSLLVAHGSRRIYVLGD